eukprot:11158158-Lingulodinium_polyedra.AAC.1
MPRRRKQTGARCHRQQARASAVFCSGSKRTWGGPLLKGPRALARESVCAKEVSRSPFATVR